MGGQIRGARHEAARVWGRFSQSRNYRRTLGWLRRSWLTCLMAVIAFAIGLAAWLNPGVDAAQVELNEGSVYVQNRSRSLVGQLNYQIDEIAAATSVGDTASTLLQEGSTVLVNNAGSSTLQAYDPATNTLSSPVSPPANAQMSLHAGKMSVTNPDNGKVWYGPVEEISRSDFSGTASLDLGDFGEAVVSTDGELIGLDVVNDEIVHSDGRRVKIPFDVEHSNASAQLSAIGNRAVVLDVQLKLVWVEGERRPVEISTDETVYLAPPIPESNAAGRGGSAIIATRAGLITIDGDSPRSMSGQMNAAPIAPVVAGDCVYGAFGSQFVKTCNGGNPQVTDIPELPEGARLAFHTNRSNVVLQDLESGRVWLVDKGMKIVDDWERFKEPDQEQTQTADETDERTTLPDRNQPNRPPIAKDDPNLGARSGRSTVLHVMDNDSDDDGDLLTITDVAEVEGASLQVTGFGSGLQITLPADATGTKTFGYTISDGRGGSASAVATVKVLPPDQRAVNDAPVNIRPSDTLVMSSGTTSSKRVLTGWRDPDGDDLVLVNAQTETAESEDEVSFTPDGAVTFRDVGKASGLKKVRVWVSDGVSTVEGQLLVDVREGEAAPPLANGDFVASVVNREVTISPLANDEGNNLTLTEVQASTDAYTVVPNYPEGTLSFRASAPGTYYLVYKVSNGPVSSGLIRVDVSDAQTENNPPVAVRDTALVPFGGSVVVDPLINDTDGDNDVLVIQSISEDPAVKVVMQERHLLTVSLVRQTDVPVPLTYWVSDGRNSTQGTIMVFPAPAAANPLPRAVNDTVKVRAGAAVSVPVLDNDVSPAGLQLKIDSLPGNTLGNNAWIDGENVRVQIAGDTPATTMNLTYQISDSSGRTDSAIINITVVSADAQNEAPIPPLVESRVLSRAETRLNLDLKNIDPNGDAVRLMGLGAGPSLGRITETGDGWMMYEAYPDSRGTDTFSYQVVDSQGAISAGEIRVGVAPPSVENSDPIGVVDEVVVAPGRTVNVPVLLNDYDVDGDPFTLREENPVEADFEASAENGFVVVKAPAESGEYIVKYYLTDNRGGAGSGSIYVKVDPNAPNVAPTAVDDQVSVNDVIDQSSVEVDVLGNDYDIDGKVGDLQVSVDPASAGSGARVNDKKLVVPVNEMMQQIRYTVTDPDGLTSQAIVLVPGKNDTNPVLAEPDKEWEVIAGEPFTVNLDTMVKGTRGRRARLTSADTVRATKGTVSIRPEGIDFQADVNYVGPASVVFEVADQADPSDTTARKSYLTVLINVRPPQDRPQNNRPDQMANTAPQGPENVTLEVGAGESDQSFPLQGRYTDPEGDNFSFRDWKAASSGDGIKWSSSVNGDVITASAAVSAKGSQLTLSGKVVDAYNASRDITVTILVIGSTRPLPDAQPDVVEDANAGQSRSVQVLANDRSFLDTDPSLSVVGAGVASGNGTAKAEGDAVVVTPAEDFVGTMTVRYTIVDATKDENRQVDGMITLTVRSKPSTPGVPTIEDEGDHYVTIKWTSNDSNGMPVISRTVYARAEDGSTTAFDECQTNTCQVTGLRNNVKYTFTVTEANALGASRESAPSAVGIPDVRPPVMAAPALFFPGAGNSGSLVLNWTPPYFDGSPITSYTLTPVVGGGAPIQVDGSTTSHTIRSLVDNTNYAFTIQATNAKGSSEPSAWSAIEHPSGNPPAATSVTGSDTSSERGGEMQVKWSGPGQTGGQAPDPVDYEIFVDGQSANVKGGWYYDGANGSAVVDAPGWGSKQHTLSIRSKSRGGTADTPTQNVEITAAPRDQAAGTLTQIGAGKLRFTLGSNSGKDWDRADVQLRINGSGIVQFVPDLSPGTSRDFTVDAFGGSYDVVMQTKKYSPSTGNSKLGPVSESNQVWGVYGTPGLSVGNPAAADDNYRQVSWTVYGNGTGGSVVKYWVNGQFSQANPWDSPVSISTGGSSKDVKIQVCDTDGSHKDASGSGENCSTVQSLVVEPVLSATHKSGHTYTVTMKDNRGVGGFWCSADGVQGFGIGDNESTDREFPAGRHELLCATGGNAHKHKITLEVQ